MAINILHPFVGLVTFSVGVLLMMVAIPRIGLSLGVAGPPRGGADAGGHAGGGPIAVAKVLPAAGIALIAAMVLSVTDSGFRSYDIVADSTGEPKLASYTADPAAPQGWRPYYLATYTWAQPYFGDDSTWLRYQYVNEGGGDLQADLPVTADVINTTNLQSFSAYGVEACYNFHGYSMRDVASVKLSGGMRGQALSYATQTDGTWSIVYWIMPVKPTKGGSTIHYERVILYLQDTPSTRVSLARAVSSDAGISNLEGSLNPSSSDGQRLISDRNFLVQFADQVIDNQAKLKAGATYQPGAIDEFLPTQVAAGSTSGSGLHTQAGAASGGAAAAATASGAVGRLGTSQLGTGSAAAPPAKPTVLPFAPYTGPKMTRAAPLDTMMIYLKLTPAQRAVFRAEHPTWFTSG